MLVSTV